MIDTIRFDLHDLQKHVDLVREIRFLKKRSVVENIVTHETHKKSRGGTVEYNIVDLFSGEKHKTIEKMRYVVKDNPTSSYELAIRVLATHIEFNFSIPKYFYGHNIAQAVPTPYENVMQFRGTTDTIEHQLSISFERLLNFIDTFFKNEFPHCDIDFTELRLKRIDLCYNLYFDTVQQKEIYYKAVNRKYAEKYGTSKDWSRDGRGVYHASSLYTFKIYDKGEEFQKNIGGKPSNKSQLEKINKREGYEVYDVDYLQKQADKILRFEFEFRESYISYLYNERIFRQKSKNFKVLKKLYNGLRGAYEQDKITSATYFQKTSDFGYLDFQSDIIQSLNLEKSIPKGVLDDFLKIKGVFIKQGQLKVNNDKSGRTITEWLCDWYEGVKHGHIKVVNEFDRRMIIKSYRKFYKDFDNLTNTRRDFRFGLSDVDFARYNQDKLTMANMFDTEKRVLFSKELFNVLGSRFMEFINEFKLEKKHETDFYIKKIEEHNNEAKRSNEVNKLFIYDKRKPKKQIDKAKLGMVLMCLENYTIKQIQENLGVDRTTIYRYKKQLEKIGWSETSQIEGFDFNVKFDFENYFFESFYSRDKMFGQTPVVFSFILNNQLSRIAV